MNVDEAEKNYYPHPLSVPHNSGGVCFWVKEEREESWDLNIYKYLNVYLLIYW